MSLSAVHCSTNQPNDQSTKLSTHQISDAVTARRLWKIKNTRCQPQGSSAPAWPEIIACDVRGRGLLQTDRRTYITTGIYIASFAFTGSVCTEFTHAIYAATADFSASARPGVLEN